jgi:hypothetical protein
MRQIDKELSFVAILICFVLFSEIRTFFTARHISQKYIYLYFVNMLFFIVFFIGLRPMPLHIDKSSCFNEKQFQITSDPHQRVKRVIAAYPGFTGQVFSYPADPIFYILFHQVPPFYPGIFDGSSLFAQQKLIRFLSDHNIRYVIYNFENYSVQDEVPNYIRGVTLHSYLLQHYTIKTIQTPFLILEKNEHGDFFKSPMIEQLPEFRQSLLLVSLEDIPRTEGIYKKSLLQQKKAKTLITAYSVDRINTYIQKKSLSSLNTFLVLLFTGGNPKQKSMVTLRTTDGFETTIVFNTCEPHIPCIIHVGNLPLFAKNRGIQHISLDSNSRIEAVSIVNIPDHKNFW